MAGKPNKPKKPRRNKGNSKLAKSATNTVNVANQPGINNIYRQIDQQNLDFQNQDQGIRSITSGAADALEPLYGKYEKASGDIAGDLQNQLSQFSAGLNQQGLPTAELEANTALYGQYGNNAFNSLASDRQRALGYDQSAMRENTLYGRYARENLQQGLSDNLQTLYNRLADIQEGKQAQIRAEMDSQRQDMAYNNLIKQLTGNALGGGGGGGGGGGNGHPGPGPNDPTHSGGQYGGPSHAAIDNQNPGLSKGSRIDQINSMTDYSSLPPWLKQFIFQYPQGGPAAWRGAVDQFKPRRRQIYRQTREHAYDLYNQEYPYANGGNGGTWNPYPWAQTPGGLG